MSEQQQITYAIDAWSANQRNPSGVEMYAAKLIEAMKTIPLAPNERVVLYSLDPLRGSLGDLPPQWESNIIPWRMRKGWMRVRVSWELFRKRPDVFFVPSQGLPFGFSTKLVTTVHDVGWASVPNVYEPSDIRRQKRRLKRVFKQADEIVTISEFSAQEIRDLARKSLKQLTVIPLAADTDVYKKEQTKEQCDTVLDQYRLGKKYFLFVGRLDAKKHVTLLLRAFAEFKSRRGVGDPYELVLVGSPGYRYAEIEMWLKDSAIKDHVHVLGYVPSDELACLYVQATACTFPSWYEGFGIPLVEAMCSGAPILASDIPAHKEVAGDAAIYLPTNSPFVWAGAMEQLVDAPAQAQAYTQVGGLRCAQFDWHKTAEATWAVLRRAA